MAPRDFITAFESLDSAKGSKLGLVKSSEEVLSVLGITLELLEVGLI
jgi:hypothetical protein